MDKEKLQRFFKRHGSSPDERQSFSDDVLPWPQGLSNERILSEMHGEVKFDIDKESLVVIEQISDGFKPKLVGRSGMSRHIHNNAEMYYSPATVEVENSDGVGKEFDEKIIRGLRVRVNGKLSGNEGVARVFGVSYGRFIRRIPVLGEEQKRKYPVHQKVYENEIGVTFRIDPTDSLIYSGYMGAGITFSNGHEWNNPPEEDVWFAGVFKMPSGGFRQNVEDYVKEDYFRSSRLVHPLVAPHEDIWRGLGKAHLMVEKNMNVLGGLSGSEMLARLLSRMATVYSYHKEQERIYYSRIPGGISV